MRGVQGASVAGLPCPQMDTPKLRVLDLFSGIGGFALGLEAAGFETVAFCEISPKCRHLLNHHWPEVPAYDDICTLTAERLRADGIAVDAICGGFPCQDISFAGKGAGLAGERSGLWREYARLIRELRPRVVIVENVSALLSRGLGDVLGDLAALGYDAEWDCIRASDVGAPHLRNRLWIVAYARGEQHEGFGDAFRRALTAELLGADLADAPGERRDGGWSGSELAGGYEPANGGEVLADAKLPPTKRQRQHGGEILPNQKPVRPGRGSSFVGDADALATRGEARNESGDSREPLANPSGIERNDLATAEPGEHQGQRQQPLGGRDGAADVHHAHGERFQKLQPAPVAVNTNVADRRTHAGRREWLSEPDVGRVAHGVPARVDRLHGLGNAVVPQIPEILGRAILAAEAEVA